MRHYLHLPLCRVLPWAVLTMNITDTARSCSGGPQQLLSHLHWSLVLGKQLMLVQRPSAFQCHWCWAAFPFPKSVLGRLADLPAANRATAPLFICRASLHTILHTCFTCLVPVRPKQLHKTYWKRSIIEKKTGNEIISEAIQLPTFIHQERCQKAILEQEKLCGELWWSQQSSTGSANVGEKWS